MRKGVVGAAAVAAWIEGLIRAVVREEIRSTILKRLPRQSNKRRKKPANVIDIRDRLPRR